jgi:hypothetical protein
VVRADGSALARSAFHRSCARIGPESTGVKAFLEYGGLEATGISALLRVL